MDLTERKLESMCTANQISGEKTLCLSMQNFKSLPDSLPKLRDITALDLNTNCLRRFPTQLAHMPLRVLKLSWNKICQFPSAFDQDAFSSLKTLNLGFNDLTSFPQAVLQLPALTELYLNDNKLTNISSRISLLSKLEVLDLNFNQISSLPPSLAQLGQLRLLSLSGNPISFPPMNVVFEGVQAIKEYLRDHDPKARKVRRSQQRSKTRGRESKLDLTHHPDRKETGSDGKTSAPSGLRLDQSSTPMFMVGNGSSTSTNTSSGWHTPSRTRQANRNEILSLGNDQQQSRFRGLDQSSSSTFHQYFGSLNDQAGDDANDDGDLSPDVDDSVSSLPSNLSANDRSWWLRYSQDPPISSSLVELKGGSHDNDSDTDNMRTYLDEDSDLLSSGEIPPQEIRRMILASMSELNANSSNSSESTINSNSSQNVSDQARPSLSSSSAAAAISSSSSSPPPSSLSNSDWACSACTFHNNIVQNPHHCQICRTPRPASSEDHTWERQFPSLTQMTNRVRRRMEQQQSSQPLRRFRDQGNTPASSHRVQVGVQQLLRTQNQARIRLENRLHSGNLIFEERPRNTRRIRAGRRAGLSSSSRGLPPSLSASLSESPGRRSVIVSSERNEPSSERMTAEDLQGVRRMLLNRMNHGSPERYSRILQALDSLDEEMDENASPHSASSSSFRVEEKVPPLPPAFSQTLSSMSFSSPSVDAKTPDTQGHDDPSDNDLDDADIPHHFLCPITYELMQEPVVLSDGHTYEKEAIKKWLRKQNTSPMTGQVLVHKNLTPNFILKSMIAELKDKQKKKKKAIK